MNIKKVLWIYILELENGNYYTGYTTNLVRRYWQHVHGTANCRYTRSFKPVRVAQCWRFYDTVGTALKIERFIKKKDRKFKESLIENPASLIKIFLTKSDPEISLFSFPPNLIMEKFTECLTNAAMPAVDPFSAYPFDEG